MARLVLIVTLVLAFLLELAMTVAGFACPSQMLAKFQLTPEPGTLFLGHVVAWFLLLVTVMIGYALWKVRQNDPLGWLVTRFLALWWVPLGISIFVFFKRPDNLFLDSLKGLILLASARYSDPMRKYK